MARMLTAACHADRRDLRGAAAEDVPLLRPHRHVSQTHVAVQYQTEIPRTDRRFEIHVGTCDDCGRTRPIRLTDLDGPRRCGQSTRPKVHALLTILNKELGLSHGKSARLL